MFRRKNFNTFVISHRVDAFDATTKLMIKIELNTPLILLYQYLVNALKDCLIRSPTIFYIPTRRTAIPLDNFNSTHDNIDDIPEVKIHMPN